jgi:hypothetical protein
VGLRPLAVADSTPFEPIEAPGDLLYLPGRLHESERRHRWLRLAGRYRQERCNWLWLWW